MNFGSLVCLSSRKSNAYISGFKTVQKKKNHKANSQSDSLSLLLDIGLNIFLFEI